MSELLGSVHSLLKIPLGQCQRSFTCDPAADWMSQISVWPVQDSVGLYSFSGCTEFDVSGSLCTQQCLEFCHTPWTWVVLVHQHPLFFLGCSDVLGCFRDHPTLLCDCDPQLRHLLLLGCDTIFPWGSGLRLCSGSDLSVEPVAFDLQFADSLSHVGQIFQAQNIRIGCSGTEAGICASTRDYLERILQTLGFCLLSLCRSFFGVFFFALAIVWSRQLLGRRSLLSRYLSRVSGGVAAGLIIPIGRVSRPASSVPSDISKPPVRRTSGARSVPVPFGPLKWIAHLLVCSLPQIIWESPIGFPPLAQAAGFVPVGPLLCGAFCSVVPSAAAMTAPEGQLPAASVEEEIRPTPSPTDLTYYGAPRHCVPWEEDGPRHCPAIVEVPFDYAPTLQGDETLWFGAHVHTPFYRTVDIACRLSEREGLHEAAEIIRNFAGGTPPGLFQVVVPVTPQRYDAFGEFIRLPHIIRYHNSLDSAAVMLDLTRIGGNYFAYVIPKLVGFASFLDIIRSFVASLPAQIYVFVGLRSQPWPPEDPLSFRDGDAVILTCDPAASVQRFTAGSLFTSRDWGSPAQLPRHHSECGICVLHGSQKIFISESHLAAGDKAAAIARAVGANLHSITTCSFPIQGLDFAGCTCKELCCVVDLPWPRVDPLLEARRDFFTHCDMRALGKFPTIVHTHHPVLHIPSFAACHGLRMPPSYTIGVIGGRTVEDEVFCGGHSTLILYAIPKEDVPPEPAGEATDDGHSSPDGDHPGVIGDRRPFQVPRGRGVRFSPGAAAVAARGSSSESDGSQKRVLGITLFAPHYQPDYIAVHVDAEEGPHAVAERLKLSCARLPVDYFDCVVPVEPLPDAGFGAYLFYSSILDHNSCAAVVIDMRPIGGRRFATVLPTRLTYDSLDQFLRVLLPRDVFAFDLFVGVRSYPMLEGSNMLLRHGMLLSVCHRNTLVRAESTQEFLFSNRDLWKSTEHLPRAGSPTGLCLITTGEDRWHFEERDYPGFSFIEAVECCLGAAEGSVRVSPKSSAPFADLCFPDPESTNVPFADLCLHGKLCKDVAIIVRVPTPSISNAGRATPEDSFLFLDFRPLGVRPHGMRQIGNVWNIPSILAKLPFAIPPGKEVCFEGARVEGYSLFADSGTTVIASLVTTDNVDLTSGPPPGGYPPLGDRGPTSTQRDTSARGNSAAAPRRRSRSRSRSHGHPRGGSVDVKDWLHPLASVLAKIAVFSLRDCGSLSAAFGLHVRRWRITKEAPRPVFWFSPAFVRVTTALGSLGQLFCRGPGLSSVLCSLWEGGLCTRCCRLLQEPVGSSPADREHLDRLRSVTLSLGGSWLHSGRTLFPGFAPEIDSEPEGSQLEVEDDEVYIGCIILKQGYRPEAFSVLLSLPCTVDEALPVVQASRAHVDRRRFPTLEPVNPQPLPGNITLIAAPVWAPLSSFQCVDTTRLDGRLWACQVPDYVARHELLHIAGVTIQEDWDLYAGIGFDLVLNENPIHVFPGCRVMIVPAGSSVEEQLSLGHLLLSRDGWLETPSVPNTRAPGDAYCIVQGPDSWLHFVDPARPMQYRRGIALCVGAGESDLDIQAARPRPADTEIQGFSCRSVLAVTVRHHNPSSSRGYQILLDGRPVLEGWSMLTIPSRSISIQQFLAGLDTVAPHGWKIQLSVLPDNSGHLRFVAGQVLVIEYVRDAGNEVETPGQSHSSQPPPSREDRGSARNTEGPQSSAHAWRPFVDEDGGPGTDTISPEEDDPMPVLIFAQEYLPELVVVPIAYPVNCHGIYAQVAQARNAVDHRRSPRLVAAFPQPCAQQACLLAFPTWPYEGVGILIDCRVEPVCLFAIIAPFHFTPEGVLGLAGFHDSPHLYVFSRDLPWPCPADTRIYPSEGDVFVISSEPRRPWHYQDLERFVGSGPNWDCHPELPGSALGTSWILSTGVHSALPVVSDNFAVNNATVAALLDLVPGQFIVVPSEPPIVDHAYRGCRSQAVLFACNTEDYVAGGSNACIPYVLDLRPILLQIQGAFAPDGFLNVAELAARLVWRCPTGFHLRLFGGSYRADEGNHYRRVQPGEVIVAEFQPDYLEVVVPHATIVSSGSLPSQHGGGDSTSAEQASERPSESSATSSRDAGTGGTRRGPNGTQASLSVNVARFPGELAEDETGRAKTVLGVTLSPGIASVCRLAFASRWLGWQSLPAQFVPVVPLAFARLLSLGEGPQGGAVEMWLLRLLGCALLDGIAVVTPFLALLVGILSPLLAAIASTGRFGPIGWCVQRPLAIAAVVLCWQFVVGDSMQLNGVERYEGAQDPDHVRSFQSSEVSPSRLLLDRGSSDWRESCFEGPSSVAGLWSDDRKGYRALPTPCRNIKLPVLDAALCVEVGCTLLEEAVCRQGDDTYFESRALLETLYEHFDGLAPAEPTIVQASATPVNSAAPLSLAQYLPSCLQHDVTSVTMCTGIQIDAVASVLGSSWEPDPVLPVGIAWHRATADAPDSLLCFADGCAAGVDCIDIYTDGSFNGSHSSWAFAAIAHSGHGSFVLAWARGSVALSGHALHIGADGHSAINGERSAVFWALCWILGVHPSIPCVVHCDCLVAMHQASGHFGGVHAAGIAAACRSLAQTVEFLRSFDAASFKHVRGHSGHPFNEMVDTLAGALQLPDSQVPNHLCQICGWAQDGSISRLWLAVAALVDPTAWPHWQYGCFSDPVGNSTLNADGLTGPDFFGAQVGTSPSGNNDPGDFRLRAIFVSVNVQSLCEDDKNSLPNRVPYVRTQLDSCGCTVAGLQETRAAETATVISESHIRFTSARDGSGCLGVELWFSRKHPLGWAKDTPIYFEAPDFRVLHWSPRALLVRYVRGSLRVLFVTCHAPTAQHSSREVWWKQFADLLTLHAKGDKVVILGDLNSRLCQELPGRIGSFVWESGVAPPEPFFRLLRALDLWVPLTYSECHVGWGHTWVAPGGTSVSRIDFVVVPVDWWVPPEGSQVLYSVDFGQAGLDHYAAQLVVDVKLRARLAFSTKAAKFDAIRACQPESTACVHEILATIPQVPWEVDAHRHYQVVSQHLLDGLAHNFPVRRTHRRKPFFSETTWTLRQQRVGLRRQAHFYSGSLANWELDCAFEAWCSGLTFSRCSRSGLASLLKGFAHLHCSVSELRKLKPLLRKSLRSDQRQYITEIANEAAVSPTKDVVQKLRPLLGPPRRKQRGVVPLPTLVLENGDFAATPAEADDRWLRHFSAVEQGGPIDPHDMILRCYDRQRGQDLEMLEIPECDLPTRCELERALRASRPGRAAGNDGLSPDVLHSFAGPISAVLYPVLLKVAFRLQEPLHFKGGTVRQIWKGRGPVEHCSSYRGILVSNTAGKSIHGAFRQRCGDWYDASATPLQIGGRKGFPVQLASQAVREFQTGHLRRGLNVAVVFLDLREAFHKVCRPLVHGGDMSDAHLVKVMQSLDLGPEHMSDLRSYVGNCSKLQDAGASPWAAAVVREFQTDSWLTIGSGLAVVESGTRPGDALADIVFSFLFSAVLHKVRNAIVARGYSVHLPWHASWFRSLCRGDAVSDTTLAPVDVSWMDDLALLLTAASPSLLVDTVSGATAVLLDECLKALLHPNLDPGKTEALLTFAGRGSRKIRGTCFETRTPACHFHLPCGRAPGSA